ncbi:MAG: hypothetical protein ACXWCL_18995, partial [Caldimonas sp.]
MFDQALDAEIGVPGMFDVAREPAQLVRPSNERPEVGAARQARRRKVSRIGAAGDARRVVAELLQGVDHQR